MHAKDAEGIANSVDPDQTAPVGGSLIWVCTVCPDLSIRKVRIITVVQVFEAGTTSTFTFRLAFIDGTE